MNPIPWWRHVEMLCLLSCFLLALPMALSVFLDVVQGVKSFTPSERLTVLCVGTCFFLFALAALEG